MDLPLWAKISVALGLAATLAYTATPVAIQTARHFAFFDRPAGYKGHAAPTPYLGGAAVMLAFALAAIVGAGRPSRTLPLLGGVAVLAVVGTVDDRRNVSPQLRVLIELTVGALLAAAGLGWKLGAGGLIDAAVTGVWVVAVVNAFNLFDNMDGAASAMAMVAAGGACVLAVVSGNGWVAAGSAALCGACLGFLPHNLASPAKIFLGDGGSMPLGFAVAVLVANAARSAEPSTLGLLAGLVLVGIPALDTALVITSRRRRGISVLTGGQDHLTHRTRQRMRTARRVALVLGGTQALVSSLVIIATRAGSTALVYLVMAYVVAAAATIVALDDVPPETVRIPGALAASPPVPADRRRRPLVSVVLGMLGLGAGLSPFFAGYYDITTWVTIGLVIVVVAAALVIARPPRWTPPVLLVLGGLGGLGLLGLVSSGWAQSVEPATILGNQWLAYAALMLLTFALLRSRRGTAVLLGAVGAGIMILAVSIIVRLLGSDPGAMFIGGRLNSPLGYVNGEACVFAMGLWLGVALAERREPWLAGPGVAMSVIMACLAVLSQSRGALIATAAAVLVALIAVPGVRRRILGLVAIAAGTAIATPAVVHVYTRTHGGGVVVSTAHTAAAMMLIAAVLVGAVWAVLATLVGVGERRGPIIGSVLYRWATVAAVTAVLVLVAGALVKSGSIAHTAKTQWHAFVHLSDASAGGPGAASQSRLLSGAGNRYDYWRIAWHVFTGHPVGGVGAGNYSHYYYLNRQTTEAIENPHSLELETLAEQGLLGALLLAAAIGGVVLGGRRLRRVALRSPAARTVMVAATGMSVVWLVNTSGDWMHLIPGVTAIGLAAGAVLCHQAEEVSLVSNPSGGIEARAAVGAPNRLLTLAGAAALAMVLAIAGASLLRTGLARRYLGSAKSELSREPGAAISDANRSLRLDSANLDAYYVKAAGLARFDRAASAKATLLQAARQDPGAYVTWVLLGDLEVRLGLMSAAKTYYGRAHALDPHDPSVAVLARDPATALRGSAGG
ncbi:MAG: O-antigen ligase family protein [Solirubrobacteraceae bacterium]